MYPLICNIPRSSLFSTRAIARSCAVFRSLLLLTPFFLVIAPAYAADEPDIVIGTAVGAPGQRVPFRVLLNPRGHALVEFRNTIALPDQLTIAPKPSGFPDCFFITDEVIFYEGWFGVTPIDCNASGGCSSLSFLGSPLQDRPPDNSPLYGCFVEINRTAHAGDYALGCVNQLMLEPAPLRYQDLGCTPGRIRVVLCTGDCEGAGEVTVDDVITGIAITLGEDDLGACYPMDQDADGAVTVTELIQAINHVMTGCSQ